jgi:hypothetical protein
MFSGSWDFHENPDPIILKVIKHSSSIVYLYSLSEWIDKTVLTINFPTGNPYENFKTTVVKTEHVFHSIQLPKHKI